MVEKSQRIKIEGTNDTDVATALAYLAGFREGTYIGRTANVWHRDISEKCVVVFHKETLERAGSIVEAMAYRGPDIVVSQIYTPPLGNETSWKPTDEYLVNFNEQKVPNHLLAKIEEEIKIAYSS